MWESWVWGALKGSLVWADPSLCVSRQRALVETHLRQICGLEQQLRQQQGLRDAAFSSPSPPPTPAPPCADLDLHYLALRGGSGLSHGEISTTPNVSTPKSPSLTPVSASPDSSPFWDWGSTPHYNVLNFSHSYPIPLYHLFPYPVSPTNTPPLLPVCPSAAACSSHMCQQRAPPLRSPTTPAAPPGLSQVVRSRG